MTCQSLLWCFIVYSVLLCGLTSSGSMDRLQGHFRNKHHTSCSPTLQYNKLFPLALRYSDAPCLPSHFLGQLLSQRLQTEAISFIWQKFENTNVREHINKCFSSVALRQLNCDMDHGFRNSKGEAQVAFPYVFLSKLCWDLSITLFFYWSKYYPWLLLLLFAFGGILRAGVGFP